MYLRVCPIIASRRVSETTWVLRFLSPEIAAAGQPGQFLNIRVCDGSEPLLRRPFSIYRKEGDEVEILYNVVGKGTALLSRRSRGESIDVLGPLGVSFSVEATDFSTAILVAGGLGVAPLPITTSALRAGGKEIVTLLGARSSAQLVKAHLDGVEVATDDGSEGFHGNVVDLLSETLRNRRPERPRIFGCGPTPMLRALADLALREQVPCEVSLEGPMACGVGICQGCPVPLREPGKAYALVCKDGPVFDARRVRL